MFTVEDQVHYVRRVPFPMEFEQAVTYALLLETFEVSTGKAVQLGLFVRYVHNQTELAPLVTLE